MSRKKIDELFKKRNELNDIDFTDLGFPSETKIYMNENLNPYYRKLWWSCRKLKKEKVVKYVWISNGSIKVRKDDTSQVIKIDHVSVLSEYFPNATIV